MARIFFLSAETKTPGSKDTFSGDSGYMTKPMRYVTRGGIGGGIGTFGPQIGAFTPSGTAGQVSKEFDTWFKFEDYGRTAETPSTSAALGYPWKCRIDQRFAHETMENPIPAGTSLSTYSMRLYFKQADQPPSAGNPNPRLFYLCNGHETYQWSYQLTNWFFAAFLASVYNQPMICSGRGATARQYSGFTLPPSGPPYNSFGHGRVKLTYNVLSQTYTYRNPDPEVLAQTPDGRTPGGVDYVPITPDRAYRLELQVDENRNPKVVARVYLADATTPSSVLSLSANPASVAADRIYFGDDDTADQYTPIAPPGLNLGQIEFWDTYDADGAFTASDARANPASPSAASLSCSGTPYRRKKYEMYEWDGSALVPLTVAGSSYVSGGSQAISATSANITGLQGISELQYRMIVPPPYRKFGWWSDSDTAPVNAESVADSGNNTLLYVPSNAAFKYSLHYPDPARSQTPPTNGWPLVVWTFSGFFISGTYRSMPRAFVYQLLQRGYAVSAVEYVRSTLTTMSASPSGYPAYLTSNADGAAAGGQFPSHAVNFKHAVKWIQSKSRVTGDSTYPIDGSKVIYMGYSAGGWVAQAAATTVGMSGNGSGVDMRINGSANANYVRSQTALVSGGDPMPLGALSIQGPVDLAWAAANDWTIGSLGLTAGGNVGEASRAFMGYRVDDPAYNISVLDQTTIQRFLDVQTAAGRTVPSLGYISGGSDYLIRREGHRDVLDAKIAALKASGALPSNYYYRSYDNAGIIHDRAMDMLDYNAVWDWLGDLPGL
jgi:hypothetical protein